MSSPVRKRPPTLQDLAEILNLSTPAISHALREREGTVKVSEKTRRRVLEVAEKLGYRQNIAARALRTGKTGTIGILSFKGLSALHTKQLFFATQEAERLGITPLVYQADPFSRKSCLQACHAMIDSRVDGVLLLSPGHTTFDQRYVSMFEEASIVVTGVNTPWIKGISCYLQNKQKGFEAIARHLVAQGYDSITLMTTPLAKNAQRVRHWHTVAAREGFQTVMKEAAAEKRGVKFQIHESLPIIGNPSVRDINPLHVGGYVEMWNLIRQNQVPRALMCQVDSRALGALRACAEAGISVPDEMAITGFEDDPAASVGSVPLTTVSHPVEEICRLAFEELVALTRGEPVQKNRFITVEGQLVVRRSSVVGHHATRPAPDEFKGL